MGSICRQDLSGRLSFLNHFEMEEHNEYINHAQRMERWTAFADIGHVDEVWS